MKRTVSFLLIVIVCFSLIAAPAHAASVTEQIYELNAEIYNSAATGDNARRYYLLPSDYIESDDEAIIDLAAEIAGRYTSDMEKARAIHDWVCKNIWYDLDFDADRYVALPSGQTALLTLEKGYALCQGYANLTVALLRAAGVPAKYVQGRSKSSGSFAQSDVTASGNHSWAEALVDRRWVIIDTTWDSGNRWQNGGKSISMGLLDRKYFDISLGDFSKDHRIDKYLPFMGAEVTDGVLVSYGGPGDDLPEGITTIGRFAFSNCNSLTKAVVPYGVELIDSGAFSGQKQLVEVSLPTTLRKIGSSAFHNCAALESIHIPNGVTEISMGAFNSCSALESVYIASTVTRIDMSAFRDCPSLLTVVIPPSVERIDSNAFGYNGYTSNPVKILLLEGFSIIGTPGSAAEAYAKNNEIPFISLRATPIGSDVVVNGKTVMFDAYNIAGNNYFKLRDLAYALSGTRAGFDVGWDGENNAISLLPETSYTPVGGEMAGKGVGPKSPMPTSSKIYMYGREVSFSAYNIGGSNYFKLRDIGAAFNFGVEWDNERNMVVIDTSKEYTA